jgi:four helix bundle protein
MTDTIFDHDRLDVYRLAIEYTAESFALTKDLSGIYRHARDQWLRASQSIPLNIAEGNGKRSVKDRARYFEIARGSAFECAAIQDVLTASDGLHADSNREMKIKLKRIVSMLTRMAMKVEAVSESGARYDADVDYEHEHRCAEHEHDWRAEPEPTDATEDRWSGFTNGSSTPGPR